MVSLQNLSGWMGKTGPGFASPDEVQSSLERPTGQEGGWLVCPGIWEGRREAAWVFPWTDGCSAARPEDGGNCQEGV